MHGFVFTSINQVLNFSSIKKSNPKSSKQNFLFKLFNADPIFEIILGEINFTELKVIVIYFLITGRISLSKLIFVFLKFKYY